MAVKLKEKESQSIIRPYNLRLQTRTDDVGIRVLNKFLHQELGMTSYLNIYLKEGKTHYQELVMS